MADVNRGNRPLSPHLQIYRLPLTARMSIFHRFTGIGLGLSGVLIVWWFLAAASSPGYFGMVDGLLTSWIGTLVMLVSLGAFWYHFFNGIRHLVWDTGTALEIGGLRNAGYAVMAAAAIMTVITLIVAI
ncbi:MAG: succinate dehydrogenase, cytochrome b556 subunit [Amaricoccus sp.]